MTEPVAPPVEARPRQAPAWLADLGPLASRRPPVSLVDAAAGVGGALVAVGAVVLAGDRWAAGGGSALALAVTGMVLAAGAAATALAPPTVRAAGVAAAGTIAPAVAFFVSAGRRLPALGEVALVTGVLLAGLYLLGPWRGHTFHLAILVAAGWLFALSLGDLGLDGGVVDGLDTVGAVLTGAGIASMAVGLAYLAAALWLHHAGLEGMVTPFLAVACLALPLGALAVARDSGEVAGGAVAVVVGAGMAVTGWRCARRGTTWTGAGLAAAGMVVVARDVAPAGAAGAGLLIAAAGAGVVVVAWRSLPDREG